MDRNPWPQFVLGIIWGKLDWDLRDTNNLCLFCEYEGDENEWWACMNPTTHWLEFMGGKGEREKVVSGRKGPVREGNRGAWEGESGGEDCWVASALPGDFVSRVRLRRFKNDRVLLVWWFQALGLGGRVTWILPCEPPAGWGLGRVSSPHRLLGFYVLV
jgi:hypothetical protein